MAQLAKMEIQLDVKSSAQKFYEIFRSKRYLFPKVCPDVVKDVRLIKGDWESAGSIMQWTYVAGHSETSLVKWAIEYEKINDDLPTATKYLELFPVIIKSIEAYLTSD